MSATDLQTSYLYLRKSRADEAEERAGIDVLSSHRSRLLDLARKDGVEVPESRIYAEIGSGDDIASRPEFVRLLGVWTRLPRNHGGVVYCTEISRLSRGLQSQQGLVQDTLSRAGVLIRTPSRYYDLRADEDAFLFECEGIIARAELRNLRRRYAATFAELTRQGRPLTGRAGFGYTWDYRKKTFEPVPEEFPILQAFLRDLFQMSQVQVAEKYGLSLNVVRLAARNPVVCGWAVKRHGRHHGDKPWKFPYAKLPPEEWVWPEQQGDWPPAISREEWEALQPILDRRYVNREKVNSDEGWCRDVLQFAGSPGRVRLGSHHENNRSMLTYELVTPERTLYISREKVHTAATDLLRAQLGPSSKIPAMILASLQASTEQPVNPNAAVAEAERRLARLRAQLDTNNLRIADPDPDPEQIASLTRVETQLRVQIKAEQSALADAQRAAVAVPRLSEVADEIAALHEHFDEAWASIPVHGRRVVVAACISLIEATVVPKPGAKRWHREVTACVPAPWLMPHLGTEWSAESLNGYQSHDWNAFTYRKSLPSADRNSA